MKSFLTIAALSFLLPFAACAENDALVETLFEEPYVSRDYEDYTTMAQRVRTCDRVDAVGDYSNYVLQCPRTPELIDIQENDYAAGLFFADSSIINVLAENDEYLYINAVAGADGRETCYRVVREIDQARDVYYAVEVCE